MNPVPTELWVLSGLLLLGLELAAPGAFMMWIGLACLGVGGLTGLARPGLAGQVLAFALFCALAVGIGLRLRRRATAVLNMPGSGLVGRSATWLGFAGPEGRVRVGDSDWPARLLDDTMVTDPAFGLEVVDVVGTVLLVRAKSGG